MSGYDDNKDFSVAFSYYGPALIQACIEFDDGQVGLGYVYAHKPG